MNDGISFIRNATFHSQPFYVNLWLHVAHVPLGPSPDQFEALQHFRGGLPYALLCPDDKKAMRKVQELLQRRSRPSSPTRAAAQGGADDVSSEEAAAQRRRRRHGQS